MTTEELTILMIFVCGGLASGVVMRGIGLLIDLLKE